MKRKRLWISSISTLIGIMTGGVYLLFAEHSLLLSDKDLNLSAFWSTFILWAFGLMFVVAMLSNVLALLELNDKHYLARVNQHFANIPARSNRQQQFLSESLQLLRLQGQLIPTDLPGDYQLLHAQRDTLVFIQSGRLPVDITQVRAMFQYMLAIDITDGIVVSSGGFSNQASIFSQEANISLLDEKSLRKQQKRAKIQQVSLIQS